MLLEQHLDLILHKEKYNLADISVPTPSLLQQSGKYLLRYVAE